MSLLSSSKAITRTGVLDLVRRCYLCGNSNGGVRPRAFANDIMEDKIHVQRRFNSSSAENLSQDSIDGGFYQEQIDKRLIVLGKSAIVACLTEHFLQLYPNLNALKIASLVSHVTKEILPFKMDLGVSVSEDSNVRRAKMYVEFGNTVAKQGKDVALSQLKKYVHEKYSNSEVEIFSKLAHPSPLLKSIAMKMGKHFEVRKRGWNSVEVYIDEVLSAKASASTREKAEYEACLAIIKEKYMGAVKAAALDGEEEVFVREFKGKLDGQRVIELEKSSDDETFGLYLKGGEKATKQTEKFWELNYIEPIFINEIVEGSPADRCGRLQESDVLLAVGDFTLSGLTMHSAASLINREDNVTLTVKYDPEAKIRSKIKDDFVRMENRAFKETLKSDKWKKWHEAQAEKNPDKYLKSK